MLRLVDLTAPARGTTCQPGQLVPAEHVLRPVQQVAGPGHDELAMA
ncbi:hypothetical protein [Asanoa ishikariensis]|nr:hypothetical protein [Asanoa ishikariensis]